MSRNRDGWPLGTVERVECVNCGAYGYAEELAPAHGDWRFGRWLDGIWPEGAYQHTRLGFFVWCSRRCEHLWKAQRRADLDSSDGWAHQHMLEMDRRRMRAGVG